MSVLQNKIDFVALVSVTNANPNGDPLDGNRPRQDYRGYGEISDVCIKRKIRNRMQDMDNWIYVQSEGREDDYKYDQSVSEKVKGYKSLDDRAKSVIKSSSKKEKDAFVSEVCKTWLDVRSFGQVFTQPGVSIGIRGPVSIHQAVSVSPVDITTMQITKSVNGKTTDGRASDVMGSKSFVRYGLYKIKGAINVQLAERTGFSEEDAETVKECLKTLFVNDSSSARPEGSMEVITLYWWKHNNKIGQYSSAEVHRSVEVVAKTATPESIEDYTITRHPLEGLDCEEIRLIH